MWNVAQSNGMSTVFGNNKMKETFRIHCRWRHKDPTKSFPKFQTHSRVNHWNKYKIRRSDQIPFLQIRKTYFSCYLNASNDSTAKIQISIESRQQFIRSGANDGCICLCKTICVQWTKSSTSALLFTFLTIVFQRKRTVHKNQIKW